MTSLIQRISLALLLSFLIFGVVGHLFLSIDTTSHAAQEANCPIHSGVAQFEKVHTFTQKPTTAIGETKDNTNIFNLGAKIYHPPTF